ncbi:MAG TPA: alternative ribosome rescue aminoacyl-tRNA hydrolase ArfB [Vicingaceae bacterium]|nr:alternative ribosome rescue aminoacyl-tRNA hydrolase ArfB [Vicingaceae bacterium]
MNKELLIKELLFNTSRSGGAGGQHVNKVATKVELQFDVYSSNALTEEEKGLVFSQLKNRINNNGIFKLQADTTRSQLKNKEIAIERFLTLLEKALTPKVARKKTKPSKASKEQRLNEKRKLSEKKSSRRYKLD